MAADIEQQFPAEFLIRLRTILSANNYQQYLQSFTVPKATSFRVNTLKTELSTLINHLATYLTLEALPWCKTAFTIPHYQREFLTRSKEFAEGLIYIQNASSIFASLVVAPQAGEEVLDLAAAPGGKTLHMAALMNNSGRIAAVEAVKDRFFRLQNNIARSGASIIQSYHKDGTVIGRLVPERFDRVLLDAPCSSEARFDLNDKATFAYWSKKKIQEMARKQRRLIYSGVQALKPGGILVYSTCSFAPEENEMIVQYALDKFKTKLEIVPINVPFENFQSGLVAWENKSFSAEIKNAIRIIPNEQFNGFFIAKMQKLQ